jgi:hypothetical protein
VPRGEGGRTHGAGAASRSPPAIGPRLGVSVRVGGEQQSVATPRGRERTGSPTLQTPQEPTLLLPWVCLRAGGFPNQGLGPRPYSNCVRACLLEGLARRLTGAGCGVGYGAYPAAGVEHRRTDEALHRGAAAGRVCVPARVGGGGQGGERQARGQAEQRPRAVLAGVGARPAQLPAGSSAAGAGTSHTPSHRP